MEGPGGGFKINLLRQALEPLKDEQDTIILFTDRYVPCIFVLKNFS